MSDNKKYYYLKLKDNFYNSDEIKLIESMPNGYEYSSFYLKLCLMSLKDEGKLVFKGRIPYKPEMLATITGHNIDGVNAALKVFIEMDMVSLLDSGEIFMNDIQNLVGSSNTEADRKRLYRKRINEDKNEYKNVELQHIPFIETSTDNKRYGGNYYSVFVRDNKSCTECGRIENLIMHHIDGYYPNKPENNNMNKLVVLCRCCHGKLHGKNGSKSSLPSNKTLRRIGYLDIRPDICPPEKELELDLEKERELKLELIVIEKSVIEFDNFWIDYNKKKDKAKCLKKWKLLKQHEKDSILNCVLKYVQSTPDVQFRKNPLTWLNGKCWEDEIIFTRKLNKAEELLKSNLEAGRRFLEDD